MAHRYDAANKFIVDVFPADWIALAGLPPGSKLVGVDADLSTVSKAADKLVRVECAFPYIARVEFQTGPDGQLDLRILVYNVLARRQLGLPVHSVVFLLRPQALTPGVTGRVSSVSGSEHRLEFAYKLVKVWELPVDQLLSGGIGTLPLAPIRSVPASDLPRVIETMKRRLDTEVPAAQSREIWTATRILMGLRYPDLVTANLLKGIMNMRESTTYQAILREGIEEGRIDEVRVLLHRLGALQLGPANTDVRSQIEAIADVQKLEMLIQRIWDRSVTTWDQLLGS